MRRYGCILFRVYKMIVEDISFLAYGSIWVFFEGFSKAWPNCIILAFKLLTRLIMNNFVAKNF